MSENVERLSIRVSVLLHFDLLFQAYVCNKKIVLINSSQIHISYFVYYYIQEFFYAIFLFIYFLKFSLRIIIIKLNSYKIYSLYICNVSVKIIHCYSLSNVVFSIQCALFIAKWIYYPLSKVQCFQPRIYCPGTSISDVKCKVQASFRDLKWSLHPTELRLR